MAFFTYIVASQRNGTLYTGSTDNLIKRTGERREGLRKGFTEKYGVHILVWYEVHESRHAAFRRERQIKEWKRVWKLELIEKSNPGWTDLWDRFWTIDTSRRKNWVPAFAGMSGELKISPTPEQQVILELRDSFRRRRKSLRARFAVVDLRDVVERVEGEEAELVEITLRKHTSPRSLTVRLKIWPDRVGRIDIWNLQTNGEAAGWSCEGRLTGPAIGKPLLDALDEAYVVLRDGKPPSALDAIWSKLFLTGPVGLVGPLP